MSVPDKKRVFGLDRHEEVHPFTAFGFLIEEAVVFLDVTDGFGGDVVCCLLGVGIGHDNGGIDGERR